MVARLALVALAATSATSFVAAQGNAPVIFNGGAAPAPTATPVAVPGPVTGPVAVPRPVGAPAPVATPGPVSPAPAPAPAGPVDLSQPPAGTRPFAPINPEPQVAGADPVGLVPSAAAASYPNMPTQWPDADQRKMMINLAPLLNSPLVLEGEKKVRAAVAASILDAQPAVGFLTAQNGTMIRYPDGRLSNQADATYCHFDSTCVSPADHRMCKTAGQWALTYDDGPSPEARPLLAALAKANVKATIFVAGSASYYNPADLKAMFDQGHEIAIHTWTHAALTTGTVKQIIAEVLYSEALVVKVTGVKPRFFRPPYGDIDNRVRAIVNALGYEVIMWDKPHNTQDTVVPTAEVLRMVNTWFTQPTAPGFISLEHNLNAAAINSSIAVLDAVIAAKAANAMPLTIVPVGACIGQSAYVGGAVAPGGAANGTAAAGPAGTVPTVVGAPTNTAAGATASQTAAANSNTQAVGAVAIVAAALSALFL